MELQQFKKIIDPLIQAFLDQKLKSLSLIGNEETKDYLNYLKLFLTEGKRIRAYLAFLTYKAHSGKKDKDILNLLVFIELLHAFLLIHDDIMDKADQRHNIKTAHKFIEEKVKHLEKIDSAYFGISQAILLGDYLFAWTHEILDTNRSFDKEIIKKVKLILSTIMDEVILGQMIDLDTTLYEKVNKEEIIKKITLKTAYYSFVRPMQIGAILSGNEYDEKFLENFGTYIGIAFQTQDDLLDIKFDESETHKSSFNDVTQRQQTFFSYFIFNEGTMQQKILLSKYFGKHLSDLDKKILRKMFEESGAIDYGEKIMVENFKSANKLLEKQKMDQEYKYLFFKLIEIIENRTS
nr:polyprenyl synthetase family protein [Candidatus Levybacteria bacterium]